MIKKLVEQRHLIPLIFREEICKNGQMKNLEALQAWLSNNLLGKSTVNAFAPLIGQIENLKACRRYEND